MTRDRKPSKFNVARDRLGVLERTVDGIVFDSRAEADRYVELLHLVAAGEIHNLGIQPAWSLHAGSDLHRTKIGEYRADFTYCKCAGHSDLCNYGQVVFEDVKGHDTPLSKWKRRHVEAEYGIVITEIRPHAYERHTRANPAVRADVPSR